LKFKYILFLFKLLNILVTSNKNKINNGKVMFFKKLLRIHKNNILNEYYFKDTNFFFSNFNRTHTYVLLQKIYSILFKKIVENIKLLKISSLRFKKKIIKRSVNKKKLNNRVLYAGHIGRKIFNFNFAKKTIKAYSAYLRSLLFSEKLKENILERTNIIFEKSTKTNLNTKASEKNNTNVKNLIIFGGKKFSIFSAEKKSSGSKYKEMSLIDTKQKVIFSSSLWYKLLDSSTNFFNFSSIFFFKKYSLDYTFILKEKEKFIFYKSSLLVNTKKSKFYSFSRLDIILRILLPSVPFYIGNLKIRNRSVNKITYIL